MVRYVLPVATSLSLVFIDAQAAESTKVRLVSFVKIGSLHASVASDSSRNKATQFSCSRYIASTTNYCHSNEFTGRAFESTF